MNEETTTELVARIARMIEANPEVIEAGRRLDEAERRYKDALRRFCALDLNP